MAPIQPHIGIAFVVFEQNVVPVSYTHLGVDAGAVCRFELLIQLLGYVLIDLLRDDLVLRIGFLDRCV